MKRRNVSTDDDTDRMIDEMNLNASKFFRSSVKKEYSLFEQMKKRRF